MKRIALILLCCAAVAALTLRSAEAEAELNIGSKAPALAIEHWVRDGNGAFEHTSKFKKGHVYVVEFWATWCGTCLIEMPHMVDLQTRYRDQKVQFISISDETPDEVEALMQRVHPGVNKTFADITNTYTLACDIDRSSHNSYMVATGQQLLPYSYIVGKTGLLEWHGFPEDIEKPLEGVVNDSWDREAFKSELQMKTDFENAVNQFAVLANDGKLEAALALAEANLAKAPNEEFRNRWTSLKHRFKLMIGQGDEETFDFYRKDLKAAAGSPIPVGEFAYTLVDIVQNGGAVGPLTGEAIEVLSKDVEKAEAEDKPYLYNLLAFLHAIDDQFEQAVVAQTKAIESSDNPRQRSRMIPLLEELKARVAEEKKEAAAQEGDADSSESESKSDSEAKTESAK